MTDTAKFFPRIARDVGRKHFLADSGRRDDARDDEGSTTTDERKWPGPDSPASAADARCATDRLVPRLGERPVHRRRARVHPELVVRVLEMLPDRVR